MFFKHMSCFYLRGWKRLVWKVAEECRFTEEVSGHAAANQVAVSWSVDFCCNPLFVRGAGP